MPDTKQETPVSDPGQEGTPRGRGVSRRSLLTGGALGAGLGVLLGGVGGASVGYGLAQGDSPSNIDPSVQDSLGKLGQAPGFGGETLSCHGKHQAGITSVPAAHARYLSYTLRPDTDKAALKRLFTLLTGDIEALTSGLGPLADPEPELAERPSRLTITVGVGAGLVNRVDPKLRPDWLGPLPAYKLDKLGNGFDGGDLIVIVQADDPLPVAHAARMLHRDIVRFAHVEWVQQGFRQARGSEKAGTTMRNLMGQVDGTVNPSPEEEDFAETIWVAPEDGQPWLVDGSAFVVRRIRMEIDTWDQVDRPGREQTMGRMLLDGAPMTDPNGGEHAPVDFDKKNALGLKVIPAAAHIRRAHSTDRSERIMRRAVNYDDGFEAGLVFGCYQRDPLKQFHPIQQRLDEADLLNEWVTHTGSAVFAVLPGFKSGEILGQDLLA